jgi:hypothetical protein
MCSSGYGLASAGDCPQVAVAATATSDEPAEQVLGAVAPALPSNLTSLVEEALGGLQETLFDERFVLSFVA